MTTDGLVQCSTCGVERDSADLPEWCPICVDERQYVDPGGQRWVSPPADAVIALAELESGLWGLEVSGGVGIGQLAKVVVTDAGTVMVDVPAAITADAVAAVRALGPMRAIIPSHPHMFGLQSLWSQALDDAAIYVSAADADWLGRRPAALQLWEGSIEPVPGVVASQPGGHFPGSSVVHWTGTDGAGVLLCSDTIMVNPDRRTVSFLRSYPNRLPLSAAVVERIAAHVDRYDFDRVYSNFGLRIAHDGKAAVAASARRHAAWVRGEFDHLTGPG
ncbi:hydrolase [Microbacterium protaetiae]|uniref:Hydrolase n=1 Tax=Microbacterium protaetiae TaxID=2509458 RepID=A0A4P6EBI8_9MICO|nr:hydrolase [Microbacterium protaetiae]QAY58663.1 hydrolase [Microbacterium protaetiae]